MRNDPNWITMLLTWLLIVHFVQFGLCSVCSEKYPGFTSYVQNGNTCFAANSTKVTANNARTLCEGAGMKLPSIHTPEENTLLFTLCSSIGSCSMAQDTSIWIGLSDRLVENTWVWDDGTPVDYLNWYSGEPNNYNNAQGGEDCVESEGRWNDIDCSSTVNYYSCQGTILNSSCFGIAYNDSSVCSGHGNCSREDTCYCDDNYCGSNCSFHYCGSICSEISTRVASISDSFEDSSFTSSYWELGKRTTECTAHSGSYALELVSSRRYNQCPRYTRTKIIKAQPGTIKVSYRVRTGGGPCRPATSYLDSNLLRVRIMENRTYSYYSSSYIVSSSYWQLFSLHLQVSGDFQIEFYQENCYHSDKNIVFDRILIDDFRVEYFKYTNTICSGHGKCISSQSCQCDEGYPRLDSSNVTCLAIPGDDGGGNGNGDGEGNSVASIVGGVVGGVSFVALCLCLSVCIAFIAILIFACVIFLVLVLVFVLGVCGCGGVGIIGFLGVKTGMATKEEEQDSEIVAPQSLHAQERYEEENYSLAIETGVDDSEEQSSHSMHSSNSSSSQSSEKSEHQHSDSDGSTDSDSDSSSVSMDGFTDIGNEREIGVQDVSGRSFMKQITKPSKIKKQVTDEEMVSFPSPVFKFKVMPTPLDYSGKNDSIFDEGDSGSGGSFFMRPASNAIQISELVQGYGYSDGEEDDETDSAESESDESSSESSESSEEETQRTDPPTNKKNKKKSKSVDKKEKKKKRIEPVKTRKKKLKESSEPPMMEPVNKGKEKKKKDHKKRMTLNEGKKFAESKGYALVLNSRDKNYYFIKKKSSNQMDVIGKLKLRE